MMRHICNTQTHESLTFPYAKNNQLEKEIGGGGGEKSPLTLTTKCGKDLRINLCKTCEKSI